MGEEETTTLDEAVAVVRELQHDTQEALAHELLDRAGWVSQSLVHGEQCALVEERLSKPREHASDEEVAAVFRKHCPDL